MKTFKEVLSGACDRAVVWVGDKTAEETIDQCHRGDWLLWFAKKVDVDRKLLILTASHCANTVRHLMPEESKKAVDVFIRYGEGKVSEEEVKAAYNAAKETNQKQTADICRKYLKEAILKNLKK